jgi:hypothetical protein
MLAFFGDGRERSRSEFAELLAAGGWRLARLRPVSGIYVVLEAEMA